jgi:hypothetical protein
MHKECKAAWLIASQELRSTSTGFPKAGHSNSFSWIYLVVVVPLQLSSACGAAFNAISALTSDQILDF